MIMIQHVNGIDLWYEKTGGGPPILLLHGNGESHSIFSVLTDQLKDRYTVYALDSRGHGQSSSSEELHYGVMAEDTAQFILSLRLEKPLLYGFSDGGIIGLLLASKYPELLSGMVISGANTNPRAIRKKWDMLFKTMYFFSRNKKIRMMLTEPHITAQELRRIGIPVLVLAGEKDIIKEEDTRFITANIPKATLKILKGENHMSYVINSSKLYTFMEGFLCEDGRNSDSAVDKAE
jgi:pimeloyl-ACP methyl ester carboxylesterase